MWDEVNTGNNLPVQFDIMAAPGDHHADELHLMFVAKGGGSANKSVPIPGNPRGADAGETGLWRFLGTKMKHAGNVGLPALSPGDRHWRHQRGD